MIQRGDRASRADKLWERRCELERRIERRGKMIENIGEVLEAKGMSLIKEAGDMREEQKKIRGEKRKGSFDALKLGKVRRAKVRDNSVREGMEERLG